LEVTTCVNVNNGSTSTPSVSLTSYDIEAGDIILTSITSKATSDFSTSCTSTGFIELTELYANDTHDSNMAVYYKVADGTETTLSFSSGTFLHRIAIVVVRGADTSVPLDATITTATGINGSAETQPDITTVTDEAGSYKVVGVVSTNPAYLMNAEADGVAVALRGRVPCKVIGNVNKGDVLVASDTPGYAMVGAISHTLSPLQIIGRSLESKTDAQPGIIEIIV